MNPNPENILNKSYQSDKKNIKMVVSDICSVIFGSFSDAELQNQQIYLAIDEAVSNAMEHGNKWDKHKLVNVNVSKNNDEISIIIKDAGPGFDTSKIKYEIDKNNILKRRGRGLFIMSKFCDLKWNNTGNELEMKIKKEYTRKEKIKS